ncbi:MAG: 23S rRNA pseudouridine synthase [bacterium P3]|nr:MAG: 23S rRNA pseudouridine synthase [bacterium P3]
MSLSLDPSFADTDALSVGTDEGDLYEHYHITVDKGQESLRIDKYLQQHLASVSRNKIQAAAKAGCILAGGHIVKPNYRVKPSDEISILLPDPPHEVDLQPEAMPLQIVYEDDDVLVVDKPAGLVVHPGYGNFTGTLLNGLLHHLRERNRMTGGDAYPYLVHRIDKDTSGLLLVAKNEEAQVTLSKQFFEHTIERRYFALVWGDFEDDSGTVSGRIGRSPKDRRVMTVYPDDPSLPEDRQPGKHAVTHWQIVERFGYVTAIECVLETGRTHQIRAHMRHIGHSLFGDAAYGGDAILKGTTFSKYRQFVVNCFQLLPRQALHARILGFEHPRTGVHLHFESPLPSDLESVVSRWHNYAIHQR